MGDVWGLLFSQYWIFIFQLCHCKKKKEKRETKCGLKYEQLENCHFVVTRFVLWNALRCNTSCSWITALLPTVTISVCISTKESICWWTALWPKLHCQCYSMQLLSITQPLVLIIYAKCWRIKNPWSSSGRLPEALGSAHDLCINTGWQKEDSSLPEFLPVSLELSSICLKWLHETTRRCQRSRLLLPLF